MHFTFPSYSGSKLFKASRLSPCMILFPAPPDLPKGEELVSPLSASKWYLCSKTLYGTSWWWLTTLSFPIQLSVGILFLFYFLRFYNNFLLIVFENGIRFIQNSSARNLFTRIA